MSAAREPGANLANATTPQTWQSRRRAFLHPQGLWVLRSRDRPESSDRKCYEPVACSHSSVSRRHPTGSMRECGRRGHVTGLDQAVC
jgi:hypothetical protein